VRLIPREGSEKAIFFLRFFECGFIT